MSTVSGKQRDDLLRQRQAETHLLLWLWRGLLRRCLIISAAVAEVHHVLVLINGAIEMRVVEDPAEFAKGG